ncbi:hypothetical protein PPERSA_08979 [Pseudocohnilembus persalinus]|uniref:Uncharacterized protein n=1 Tax=Pseudocohnilembus persalinus TaxID=266149 RepID=A0A0V0R326_PSEPJ|nr:hypothetical protein PPERSA_08979 [Pseudocohnilembus persalinus]|eukprot:KRX08875.1 hypothetical protein PPERSA_08979 [Pseudocohnilembus persalinus]
MVLFGKGCPFNGHGGISYVKELQKSRQDKSKNLEDDPKKKIIEEKKFSDDQGDQRKISEEKSKEYLKLFGVKEEVIDRQGRWEKVTKREMSNCFEGQSSEIQKALNEIVPYMKDEKLTTKMKQEKYQGNIDSLFGQLVRNLLKNSSKNFEVDLNHYEPQDSKKNLEYYLEKEKYDWERKRNNILMHNRNSKNKGFQENQDHLDDSNSDD